LNGLCVRQENKPHKVTQKKAKNTTGKKKKAEASMKRRAVKAGGLQKKKPTSGGGGMSKKEKRRKKGMTTRNRGQVPCPSLGTSIGQKGGPLTEGRHDDHKKWVMRLRLGGQTNPQERGRPLKTYKLTRGTNDAENLKEEKFRTKEESEKRAPGEKKKNYARGGCEGAAQKRKKGEAT